MKNDSWVIYEQSPPFSPSFVARRWELRRHGYVATETRASESLEGIRNELDLVGFTRVEPKPGEGSGTGAVVVETWLRLRH